MSYDCLKLVSDKDEPFGVYVHWPFCQAKCPYCDFNSHVRHKPVDQEVFVEAYKREIEYMTGLAPGRKVSSIFFGGGTPSLMEPETVGTIIEAIANYWTIDSDAEITLEANPSSVENQRFKGYRQRGVNRLSLGVQSLDDKQLKFLGRLHNVEEAKAAISLARQIFPRLSFDMIYARPRQTLEEWESELGEAIKLAADHLSLYQLTIEQGTPFFDLHARGKIKVPDPDLAADFFELTQDITKTAGLPAYEISNHAAKGAKSRHNLTYWRYYDYAGIGPGAHGRLTIDDAKHATACIRNPEQWWQQVMVEGHGMEEHEKLSNTEMADEFLLMGLRLREGIDPQRYAGFNGAPLSQKRMEELSRDGLIEIGLNGNLRTTASGFMVLDAVVADLARQTNPISDSST